MPKFSKLLKFSLYCLCLWGVITLGSFAPARTILQQADLTPAPYAPTRLDDPQASFAALESAIYGPFTPPAQFDLTATETLTTSWLSGKATVVRREYTISHGQTPQVVEFVFVTPKNNDEATLIISQNFSSNRAVISADKSSPLSGASQSMGPLGGVLTFFFGRYIIQPPLERIIDRGYGFVAVHPPSYVEDHSNRGSSQLDEIFGEQPDRPGALTVWASLTTELAKTLKAEMPNRQVYAFGHSRYGKTALLAAAYSPYVDGVIAHQSGTAGASLMRDKTGETLKDVVRGYPHWLSPSAADYADNPRELPTDAHALLAVISPKPIFLGNARRDVWSDPEGAFHAAKWAADSRDFSFSAKRLNDFEPSDDIAIWTRPGTHGVVKEDWPAFLDFLDSHAN